MENIAKKVVTFFPYGTLFVDYKDVSISPNHHHKVANNYVPSVKIQNGPLNYWYNRSIKRTFDIVFSLLVITLVLSWLIPIVGLVKYIFGEKGLFFIQQRSGYQDHPFRIIKFRTMRKNGFSDIIPATRNDERITKVGRFLRCTSIDELPQFFNVLVGNMSVFGPRPLINQHDKEYKAVVNKFMVRHTVKPGISGYAQVNGHRGEIRGVKDMKQRIEFDVSYIENWSIWLDFKIAMLTIVKFFKGDSSAY